MKHYLPPCFVAVDHHAETALVGLFYPGHLLNRSHHGLEIRHSCFVNIHQGRNMLPRNDNYMDRRYGMDVLESKDQIKVRLKKSPDKAESLLQTFAVAERLRAASAPLGAGFNQPFALIPGSSIPARRDSSNDGYDPLGGL